MQAWDEWIAAEVPITRGTLVSAIAKAKVEYDRRTADCHPDRDDIGEEECWHEFEVLAAEAGIRIGDLYDVSRAPRAR